MRKRIQLSFVIQWYFVAHSLFWRYKNTTLTLLGSSAALVLYQHPPFHALLLSLGKAQYAGAFVAGMLFVSIFTVALGAMVLVVLSEQLPVLTLVLVAGSGAVLADLVLFRFIRTGLLEEIVRIERNAQDALFHQKSFKRTYRTARRVWHRWKHATSSRYRAWTLPLLGLIVLASPLPDEIGIGLLGISHVRTVNLIVLLFIIKPASIFLLLTSTSIVSSYTSLW